MKQLRLDQTVGNLTCGDRYPKEQTKNLFFNSDIENFLLKTNGLERKPNFVTFLVWSVLIVGGSIVVAWSRNSCLGRAEITSLCSWFY